MANGMKEVKLVVILEPASASRAVITGNAPFFTGGGNTNLLCSSCNTILAEKVVDGQVKNLVFKCPKCGSYCEQIAPPSFAVPENRTIGLAKGTYNFSAPVKCPPNTAIIEVEV
jgi:phage FluMu protein Com